MKSVLLFIVSCYAIGVIAQENPYCPCQEEARQEHSLQLVMQQGHYQTLVYIQQQDRPETMPVNLPHRDEEMLRINVRPQIEKLPIEIEQPIEVEEKEELSDKEVASVEPEESIIEASLDDASLHRKRTKLKTRKKLFRKRLKRKKRKIKYRGSCPRF